MSGRTSGRGKITHTNTKHHKQTEKETINPKQKTDRKRAEREPDTKGKTKDTRKKSKRPKFCVFLTILKKSVNKADRIRAKEGVLGRFKALSIYGAILAPPEPNKTAWRALFAGVLFVRCPAVSGLQAGACHNRRGSGRNNPSGAGYQASGGATTIKAGEGVSNQNGKGRVALKKISVQFWQNLFPYQNVLVLKKFLQKFLEKQKGGYIYW